MQSDENLKNLIKRCQQGRQDAFAELLQLYGPRLYGYYLRTSGSTQQAEDLLQDLFVRLLEKIKNYRHENKFDNWLFTVAANLARDQARRKDNKLISLDQNSDDSKTTPVARLIADQATPLEQLLQHEQHDKLKQALQQLPQQDREIIMLRHYGQLSFKEIAEHFEMPIGSALAKVHRGLKKLKRILKDYEG
jgi:RNA polymerase sigma-70 factor, ECF subfamily